MKPRSCLLCKSTRLATALKLKPTPLADDYIPKSRLYKKQPSYPLTLKLCKNCGHVQLQDIIPPEVIYRKYIYQTANSPGLVKHFHELAQEVLASIKPPAHSLIIDIGSNDGTLLKEFKKAGMNVLGFDPARHIAQIATKAGVRTLSEFFTVKLARFVRKKYGQAAIITANNVFANIEYMDEFVNALKEIFAPDGVFIFESFYIKDLVQNKVFDFIFHEHISYFSVKPLTTFFRNHNMEIIDVKHLPTKGGSVRCTVQRSGGPRKVSASVSQFVEEESKIKLHNIQTYKKFYSTIVSDKKALWKLLKKLNKEHAIIAGYGASASCTTLLYHFELNDTLAYLIDENPIKLHTYSPGKHLRVVHPSEISVQKPDYILILAWRFAKQIIDSNQHFLNHGGHFIVPLPTLQVV